MATTLMEHRARLHSHSGVRDRRQAPRSPRSLWTSRAPEPSLDRRTPPRPRPPPMSPNRLEAFSDGVLAIIITIMVLELRVPHAVTVAALAPLWPVFLSYVLSFVYLGIYWNNHHHMLHVTERVTGTILWANLHLLFWLSLVPFTTGWMGENHFAAVPTALYGIVLLMASISYYLLQRTII